MGRFNVAKPEAHARCCTKDGDSEEVMKGFMPAKIIEYHNKPLPVNDRWVKGGWLFVVKECKKILWFYKIVFERGVFEEGEF